MNDNSERGAENTKQTMSRLIEKTEVIETELFTTRKTWFENSGELTVVEMFDAFFALANRSTGQAETRRVMDVYREFAERTIAAAEDRSKRRKRIDNEAWWQQLRRLAFELISRIVILESRIRCVDLHGSIQAAMCMERTLIKLDQTGRYAEFNAALGKKKRESLVLGGKKRQEDAAKEAAARRKRVQTLHQSYLDADYEPGEIPRKIAKRLNIDESIVRRDLKPKKSTPTA